jgi:hypothetical protein
MFVKMPKINRLSLKMINLISLKRKMNLKGIPFKVMFVRIHPVIKIKDQLKKINVMVKKGGVLLVNNKNK